ncbi:PREDICTED: cytochrome P450 2U1-like [Priapulus caudatus]|uniref:Cytochrome P450 2U1-like n=1 Tax=Priapulus caudatus TaxID=37621 RepID=A0ABM1ER24_PRICU|nr:PREDICTED: cytochrome P450 2U1-like [Priapulus caudatus]
MDALAVALLAVQKILLFSIVIVVAAFVWHLLRRPRNLPPGPRGYPLVGSNLSFGDRPDRWLMGIAKQYGPVVSVYMGPKLTIVLNDVDSVRDAFLKQGDVFSERPSSGLIDIVSKVILGYVPPIEHGVIGSSGLLWKEQRKFALGKLREFGMGKVSLETKIKEEISVLLMEIKTKSSEPFDIQELVTTSVSNVICSIVFGNRYEYGEKQLDDLMRALNALFVLFEVTGLLNYAPWLRHIPGFRGQAAEVKRYFEVIHGVLKQQIAAHLLDYDESNIRDFIDVYIKEMHSEHSKGRHQSTTFNMEELLFVVWDLFAAGTETTSTTTRWAMLFMLKYPDVCKKVQAEIDDVIGRGRMPCMADKTKMPYTEATIMEIQRLGTIVPLGVPHSTSEKVEFRGFSIPAHTQVIANQTAVMLDQTYFPNPEKLSPERYLDENGNITKIDALIPFSIGRRVCLGEALAKMELFLLFTSILQNFNLELPGGVTEPSLDGIFGITWMPKANKIRFCMR